MVGLPYEYSRTGKGAVHEMEKVLRRFGATEFGVMERFDRGEVLVQFAYHGVPISLTANVHGYTAAWLREHPWSARMKMTEEAHRRRGQQQAAIAVWSILRDWIKGQITAIETGILSFEAAFLGQMMLGNGETVFQRVQATGMLPRLSAPETETE